MIVDSMYCSLCNKPHVKERLQKGWFAEHYKRHKRRDSASKLLCHQCADKFFAEPKMPKKAELED